MKIEIDEDARTFRLVDGVDGTSSYQTGDTVDWGEHSDLIRDLGPDAWALVDVDGNCDGLAHLADGTVEPVSFELGCEFEDSDDEEGEGDDDDDEVTTA